MTTKPSSTQPVSKLRGALRQAEQLFDVAAGDGIAVPEQLQYLPLAGIEPAQPWGDIFPARSGRFLCPLVDALKAVRCAFAEVLHPLGDVGLGSAQVVIVRRADKAKVSPWFCRRP